MEAKSNMGFSRDQELALVTNKQIAIDLASKKSAWWQTGNPESPIDDRAYAFSAISPGAWPDRTPSIPPPHSRLKFSLVVLLSDTPR
jgi:hypothetical protein